MKAKEVNGYEQFSPGVSFFENIHIKQLNLYIKAAEKTGIKLEYMRTQADVIELRTASKDENGDMVDHSKFLEEIYGEE